MTTLAYSHTLVAGAPENINDVQDMFNDARTVINGNLDATNLAATAKPATLMGAYRTVSEAYTQLTSAATGATTWLPCENGLAIAVGGAGSLPVFLPITLADFAVSGLTTQFRVQAATITNSVAPAVNFTFGLQQVTALGGSSSTIAITTLGGSPASVTRSAPPALNALVDATSDFTIGATGIVCVLTVAASGTPAANSCTTFRLRLQVHNI